MKAVKKTLCVLLAAAMVTDMEPAATKTALFLGKPRILPPAPELP